MNNEEIEIFLKNNLKDFTINTSLQQRSVADIIEYKCCKLAKDEYTDIYLPAKSKRSIEDFCLVSDTTNCFDVKTHHIQESGFSMPNLISIDRLRKLLLDSKITLSYVFIDYKRIDNKIVIENINIKYIWQLDWSVLSIGSLGKGQLQILDNNKEMKYTDVGREEWSKILLQKGYEYNLKQMQKIQKEIKNWQ
ncbi:MAG: hypothetical protein M0R46_06300 [Candidatus Muirbacterium halophilum]|nr:hypothetical protein [Candidatus Muirbacterium halophilum]